MWDFFETVRHRHSVRKYQADMPVPAEKLNAILETACTAPTAGDLQSYRIVVVTRPEERAALRAAAQDQPFITEAPVALVFCTDPARAGQKYGDRGRSLYAVQDATIAAAYAQLATVAAGMGAAWVGYFDDAAVTKALGIGKEFHPVAIICVGFPAELPELSPRRPLKDIVQYR